MSIHSPVTVTVPATTANLGPGFDCIGAALTLYNRFTFTRLSSDTPWETERAVRIRVSGVEATQVKTDDTNLAYQAFLKLYEHIGHTPPPVQLKIELDVPLARGLGSSATAIVGGLVGANQLAGEPLSQTEVMQLAIALEGHPDNVVPALLGGCRLAVRGDAVLKEWEICDIPWHDQIVPVVAIPNFELSTQQARQVLPPQLSQADAIFNLAHFGLLIRALATGRRDWLHTALQDRLHQPYRQTLIPGYDAVQTAALKAGAYGMTISGAGPTLLALVDPMQAETVATTMAETWQHLGISVQARSLAIDTQGTQSAITPAV
jgi:homoserine kinase